jgi:hypothetical protein
MLHPGFYLHLPAWMQGGPDVRLGCTDKLDVEVVWALDLSDTQTGFGAIENRSASNGMARVS